MTYPPIVPDRDRKSYYWDNTVEPLIEQYGEKCIAITALLGREPRTSFPDSWTCYRDEDLVGGGTAGHWYKRERAAVAFCLDHDIPFKDE